MKSLADNLFTGTNPRGMSLVEVLVTVFVLSVGLLGVASLQGVAKKTNHQAYQRTLATHLVDGIIERIRANPRAAANYHTGTANYLGGKATAPAEPSPTCTTGACTTAQLAAHDLWEWERAVDGATVTSGGASVGGLMSPRGCIILAVAAGKTNTGSLQVLLNWEGLTDISDAVAAGDTACGAAAGSDASRRQVAVTTYVYDMME